ncbi:MAG TPA: YggS family pyridoxal phosphate-dependent enzyme [Mycobacteriales bacterium]
MTAAERLAAVRARIDAAARAAGRPPSDVRLVAVSKLQPVERVRDLVAAGQVDFGESRAQELGVKAAAVDGVRWHFVGRLQRNKARAVAATAAWVHSLDRAELVPLLARGAGSGAPLSVLVQVTLDGDPERGGADPREVLPLAARVADEPRLRLAGVMAVAVPGRPARPQFARLQAIADDLRREHPAAGEISAGMSADLEAAVAEGATLVRVGTALFGARALR